MRHRPKRLLYGREQAILVHAEQAWHLVHRVHTCPGKKLHAETAVAPVLHSLVDLSALPGRYLLARWGRRTVVVRSAPRPLG